MRIKTLLVCLVLLLLPPAPVGALLDDASELLNSAVDETQQVIDGTQEQIDELQEIIIPQPAPPAPAPAPAPAAPAPAPAPAPAAPSRPQTQIDSSTQPPNGATGPTQPVAVPGGSIESTASPAELDSGIREDLGIRDRLEAREKEVERNRLIAIAVDIMLIVIITAAFIIGKRRGRRKEKNRIRKAVDELLNS